MKLLWLIKWCLAALFIGCFTIQCTNENMQAELEDLKDRVSELNRQVTDAHVRIEDLNNRLYVLQDQRALGNHEAVPQDLKVVKLVPKKEEKSAVNPVVQKKATPVKTEEPVLISNWDEKSSLKKKNKVTALKQDSIRQKEDDYQKGLELFKKRKFNQAIAIFSDFLVNCKNKSLKDNAIFWIARSWFEKAEFTQAEKKFQEVLKIKSSNKIADSLLFLGMIARSRGDNEMARKYWTRLITDFPREQSAKKAKAELEEIGIEPQAD